LWRRGCYESGTNVINLFLFVITIDMDTVRIIGRKLCFITLTPGAHVIKLFCRSNLPPFHGNTVILCHTAILSW
jgi:hypothetical protein